MEFNTSAKQKSSEIQPSDKGWLRISKVPYGDWKSISFGPQVSWVKEILVEICNHYEIDPENTGNLEIDLSVLRKKDIELGEHLVVNGRMKIHYTASCIKCLEPFSQDEDLEFDLCIVEEALSKEEQYEEVTEVFSEEKERDLYFYSRGQIDFQALLRELVLLELNPLPIHDADCKGLCFECGTNLNHEQCSHSNSK